MEHIVYIRMTIFCNFSLFFGNYMYTEVFPLIHYTRTYSVRLQNVKFLQYWVTRKRDNTY